MAPVLYYVKLYAPFQTIRGFKLELQSRNSQFGSKLAIFFLSRDFETMSSFMHNLKLLVNPNWSYSPETLNWVKIGDVFFFVPRDLEIWRMTLKNNMAPLLYQVKLYAPFQTIGEFKLELQSRKSHFGSRLEIFFAVWPYSPETVKIGGVFFAAWLWNLTDDIEKQ